MAFSDTFKFVTEKSAPVKAVKEAPPPKFTKEQSRELGASAIRDVFGTRFTAALALKALGIERFTPETKAQKFLFGKEEIVAPKGKAETGLTAAAAIPIIGTGKKTITEKAVDPVSSYLTQRVSTSVGKVKEPLKTKFYNGWNRFYTAAVDRFDPIAKTTKQAEQTAKLLPGENPAYLARAYLGVKGQAEQKLYWNTFRLTPEGNLEVTGKSLSETINPFKNNLDDLRALMVAERDLELTRRGILKGATPKESRNIIDYLTKKYGNNFAQLNTVAKGVRDYTRRAVLDPLKESGLISNKVYQNIISSNEFYAPFKRVIDDLESQGFLPKKKDIFQPKGAGIKRIKGSEKLIVDPLETIISETYRVADVVARHNVARAVVALRNVSKEMEELIKPIKPTMISVAREGEKVIIRPSFLNPKNNTIMVFEDGVRKFYEVAPDLAKAMNGMSTGEMAMTWKLLSLPAKTLRAGATLSPEFTIRNPIRDQFSAMVQAKYGFIPGVDFISGLWSLIRKDESYRKWLAAGGARSMFVSLDRISNQRTLFEVAHKGKDIFTPQEALVLLKRWGREPLLPLRAFSEATESATRLGVAKKATRKGATALESSFESREATLDFARIGSQTQQLNMINAFLNANIQGTDKLIRAFKDRPLQSSMRAIVGITIPSISLYLLHKDNPRYKELPEWQKNTFWIIVPPGKDSPIIRVPKPFTLGAVFGTAPEKILEWVNENDPEALKGLSSAIFSSATPNLIPTIMLPWVENTANYSFFRDRPIVGERISGLPPELQANTYTSETAKEIGKLIKQSPAKLDNLVSGYLGGLGKYTLETIDLLLEKTGIVKPVPAPEKELSETPVIRAFIAREPIGSQSESVNNFYELLEKAEQAEAAFNKIADSGDIDGAAKYLKEHNEALMAKHLRKSASDLAEISKARNQILEDKDISPADKRKLLNELDLMATEYTREILILTKEATQ